MNTLNIALVRILQFSVFVLFTFMFLVYVGTMLLLPLAFGVHFSSLLSLIGLPSLASILVAGGTVVFLVLHCYKVPGLFQTIGDIGVELVSLGHARVKSFNDIAAGLSG